MGCLRSVCGITWNDRWLTERVGTNNCVGVDVVKQIKRNVLCVGLDMGGMERGRMVIKVWRSEIEDQESWEMENEMEVQYCIYKSIQGREDYSGRCVEFTETS